MEAAKEEIGIKASGLIPVQVELENRYENRMF